MVLLAGRTAIVTGASSGIGHGIVSRFIEEPMQRAGTPADAVAAVTFLVSDEAGFITGVILPIGEVGPCRFRGANP